MDTIRLDIDLDMGISVLCAAVCKRLRSLGWSVSQAALAEGRIAEAVSGKMARLLEPLMDDLVSLCEKNAGSEQYQASAWASFALAGIEIADSLHAERN